MILLRRRYVLIAFSAWVCGAPNSALRVKNGMIDRERGPLFQTFGTHPLHSQPTTSASKPGSFHRLVIAALMPCCTAAGRSPLVLVTGAAKLPVFSSHHTTPAAVAIAGCTSHHPAMARRKVAPMVTPRPEVGSGIDVVSKNSSGNWGRNHILEHVGSLVHVYKTELDQ